MALRVGPLRPDKRHGLPPRTTSVRMIIVAESRALLDGPAPRVSWPRAQATRVAKAAGLVPKPDATRRGRSFTLCSRRIPSH